MVLDFNEGWFFKNDGNWLNVCLPHDAMIDSPRSKDANGGGACAYYSGGLYEYKKELVVSEEWKEKSLYLIFEGIYRNPTIYLDEKEVGHWAYGYTRSIVSLGKLEVGKHEIKVVADNSKAPNSRWYSGGGIYRPVSLMVKDDYSFIPDSIKIETMDEETIQISSAFKGEASFRVYDGEKEVASRVGNGTIRIKNAKLWDENHPFLYTLKAEIKNEGKLTDSEEISFGMRLISYSSKGFFVNGKSVLLRGACMHHDNGLVGSRSYPEAEERRAYILKKAGFNAVRCAHNPVSVSFLNACDKLGLYVLDEAFDMWYSRKRKYDYALDFPTWHGFDLKAMVEKDKNHPCVIAYSIGNEVGEPSTEKGLAVEKEMIDLLHSLDNRPVTAGINLFIVSDAAVGKGIYSDEKAEKEAKEKKEEKPTSSTLFNMIASSVGPSMNNRSKSSKVDKIVSPCLDLLDFAGYNYASGRYRKEGKLHPNRLIFGSETFPQDIYKNWQMVKELPYLFGDFMWAGWDYLGEAGIGGWCYETQYGFTFEKPYPWKIADTGAIDITGYIGAQAKYASTVWGFEKKPIIAVKPFNHPHEKLIKAVWRGTNAIESWSWKGCEGNQSEVEIYSTADKAVLFLNGKKLGSKKLKGCKAIFKAKYEPGKLEVVCYDKEGKETGRNSLTSAEKPMLHISCEKLEKGRICYFPVTLDENGVVESNDFRLVELNVKGGKLLAFGSAEQKSEEPYSSNKTNLYYGRALAIILVEDDKLSLSLKDGESIVTQEFAC